MAGDQGGGFGGRLREARERRGLSLRDIALATKIPIRMLEALERNDLPRLPGGIFSRAYVRAYATQVGLDPDAALRDFIAQLPQEPDGAPLPLHAIVEDSVAIESERRTATTVLWMILISVPIAGTLLYWGSVGRQSTSTPLLPLPATPASSALKPGPKLPEALPAVPVATAKTPQVAVPDGAAAAPPPSAAPSSAAVAAPQLAVAIAVTSGCRVTAVLDGKPLIDREFAAGERQSFAVRRDLVLTVTDPTALELTLNGVQARPLGPGGEAATIRVTPANYTDYLAVP